MCRFFYIALNCCFVKMIFTRCFLITSFFHRFPESKLCPFTTSRRRSHIFVQDNIKFKLAILAINMSDYNKSTRMDQFLSVTQRLLDEGQTDGRTDERTGSILGRHRSYNRGRGGRSAGTSRDEIRSRSPTSHGRWVPSAKPPSDKENWEVRAMVLDASQSTGNPPSYYQIKKYFEGIVGPCWVDRAGDHAERHRFMILTNSTQVRHNFLTTLRKLSDGTYEVMHYNPVTKKHDYWRLMGLEEGDMELMRNYDAEQGQTGRERPPPEHVMQPVPQDVVSEAAGSAAPPVPPAATDKEPQRSEPTIPDLEAIMNRVMERQIGELRTELQASVMAQNKRINGLVKTDRLMDLNEVNASAVDLEEEDA